LRFSAASTVSSEACVIAHSLHQLSHARRYRNPQPAEPEEGLLAPQLLLPMAARCEEVFDAPVRKILAICQPYLAGNRYIIVANSIVNLRSGQRNGQADPTEAVE
jgi:hypothetical protein